MTRSLYQEDFYAWCEEQAEYIKGHRFEDIDVVNVEEEIRSLRYSVERELEDYLGILFTHFLLVLYCKDSFIYPYRIDSWKRTIREHRRKVRNLLEDCPSLSKELPDCAEEAYKRSRYFAYQRTSFSDEIFPEKMPFTIEEALTENWLPQ